MQQQAFEAQQPGLIFKKHGTDERLKHKRTKVRVQRLHFWLFDCVSGFDDDRVACAAD